MELGPFSIAFIFPFFIISFSKTLVPISFIKRLQFHKRKPLMDICFPGKIYEFRF